jgi:hypothetical protein
MSCKCIVVSRAINALLLQPWKFILPAICTYFEVNKILLYLSSRGLSQVCHTSAVPVGGAPAMFVSFCSNKNLYSAPSLTLSLGSYRVWLRHTTGNR